MGQFEIRGLGLGLRAGVYTRSGSTMLGAWIMAVSDGKINGGLQIAIGRGWPSGDQQLRVRVYTNLNRAELCEDRLNQLYISRILIMSRRLIGLVGLVCRIWDAQAGKRIIMGQMSHYRISSNIT